MRLSDVGPRNIPNTQHLTIFLCCTFSKTSYAQIRHTKPCTYGAPLLHMQRKRRSTLRLYPHTHALNRHRRRHRTSRLPARTVPASRCYGSCRHRGIIHMGHGHCSVSEHWPLALCAKVRKGVQQGEVVGADCIITTNRHLKADTSSIIFGTAIWTAHWHRSC